MNKKLEYIQGFFGIIFSLILFVFVLLLYPLMFLFMIITDGRGKDNVEELKDILLDIISTFIIIIERIYDFLFKFFFK